MPNNEDIIHELQLKELYLLHHDHNNNPEELEAMIAPDFYEVASNGSIVDRDLVIDWLLQKDQKARWTMNGFKGTVFSSLVHVVYHAKQVEGQTRPSNGSWRTSLWKKQRGRDQWQLLFHQATSVNE